MYILQFQFMGWFVDFCWQTCNNIKILLTYSEKKETKFLSVHKYGLGNIGVPLESQHPKILNGNSFTNVYEKLSQIQTRVKGEWKNEHGVLGQLDDETFVHFCGGTLTSINVLLCVYI